ncbi:hypothetical protein QZH41_016826 [Actinostola sp. cb2023]|nr:hypothetical protein QZH41_016826 [Actinostola sp. cb2023]
MAGVMNSDSKKMVSDKIDITEDDIPGAKISRESIEQCSVVQLKRWLLCRGAKTSGKKATLITRVKDYIQNGLDSKYLRDPDGGINILRKKAQLGVLDNEEPDFSHTFPREGFKCDLKGYRESLDSNVAADAKRFKELSSD